MTSRRRRMGFAIVAAALALTVVEGLAAITASVAGRALRAIPDVSTLAGEARIAKYLKERDPLLGWVPRGKVVDASGARRSPAFPEPTGACVAVYGDSFAWGSDVEERDAWPNVLARTLGCRVTNYGVPGYGFDQALLRFERGTPEQPPWVVLSIFPDNVLRCLTSNVGFAVQPGINYGGLKPRFELQPNGSLALRPIAFTTAAALRRYAQDPVRALQDDPLSPNSVHAIHRVFDFPYLLSFYRYLKGERARALVQRALTKRPLLEAFLRPGHPTRSYELSAALVERFARSAAARGARLLLVVLPDQDIATYHAATGIWAHADLIGAFARSAPVINMGARFEERLGNAGYASIQAPGGHYTPRGYALIAERVAEELQRLGFTRP